VTPTAIKPKLEENEEHHILEQRRLENIINVKADNTPKMKIKSLKNYLHAIKDKTAEERQTFLKIGRAFYRINKDETVRDILLGRKMEFDLKRELHPKSIPPIYRFYADPMMILASLMD